MKYKYIFLSLSTLGSNTLSHLFLSYGLVSPNQPHLLGRYIVNRQLPRYASSAGIGLGSRNLPSRISLRLMIGRSLDILISGLVARMRFLGSGEHACCVKFLDDTVVITEPGFEHRAIVFTTMRRWAAHAGRRRG